MLRTVVAGFVLLGMAGASLAHECDAILEQGVRNIFATKETSNFEADMQSAFCNSSASEYGDQVGAGLDIGFSLYDVPIKLGGNYNSSDYKKMQQKNCGANSSNFASSGYHELLSAVADPQIIAAWSQCKQSGGLYINAEANGNTLIYTFRFRPAGPVTETKLIGDPQIIGAACPSPVVKDGTVVSNVSISQICYRQSSGPVTTVANSQFNSFTLLIPEIRKDIVQITHGGGTGGVIPASTCPLGMTTRCIIRPDALPPGTPVSSCDRPAGMPPGTACTCPKFGPGQPPPLIGTFPGTAC
ncbi:hypothetical protein [Burkholderia sp. GbtcB21]|uniref:hypothetical protein n=1 Tax=Burkholderia sp. GbtcB21 TaxID=2824766 RepID=UPI001C304D9C|nr:hypothetical protein [Burkholderia sp. GbtcB21]